MMKGEMELREIWADYSQGEGDIGWTSMMLRRQLNMVIFKGSSNYFGNEIIFLPKYK